MPAPLLLYPVRFLHQFSTVEYISAKMHLIGAIWDKIAFYLVQI